MAELIKPNMKQDFLPFAARKTYTIAVATEIHSNNSGKLVKIYMTDFN